MMRRPRKNPNRWMINYVPVMPEKKVVFIDWVTVIAMIMALGVIMWLICWYNFPHI